MQKSRVLGSLKLFPPIHQPLPLNKRESQRLLDAIKTSFRARLDEEHAAVVPGSARFSLPAKPTLTYLPSSAASPSAPPEHGPHRPTDRHMHAILQNPLFSPIQMAQSTRSSVSLEKHKEIFQTAVSRGLMDLTRAHGFLKMVEGLVGHSPTVSVQDGLKPAGAGRLVLQWLRSSGQERDFVFLRNPKLRATLLRFMVAEDLDHVFWEWFQRLVDRMPGQAKPKMGGPAAIIIRDFVTSKTLEADLEGAYTAILKAEAMVKEKGVSPDMLRGAWTRLAFESTANPLGRQTPPVHLFDPFVALGQAIGSQVVDRAHLNLYHPVEPSSELAVDFLSSEETWESMKGRVHRPTTPYSLKSESPKVHYFERVWWLGLDTVQHLMQLDRSQEASRVWDLLETHLSSWKPALPGLDRY
jgi:hypothetical protein